MAGNALGKAQAAFDVCNDFAIAKVGVNALN